MKITKMLAIASTSALLALSVAHTSAQDVSVNYSYSGSGNRDLSGMTTGPLHIAPFKDLRQLDDSHLIAVDEQFVRAEEPVADLVQGAIILAFQSNLARLADAESPLTLEGNLVELTVNKQENSIEVLLRCDAKLMNQGRTAWQTVLFSRVNHQDPDDLPAAIQAGLDQLVRELLVDDYFMMELGIF